MNRRGSEAYDETCDLCRKSATGAEWVVRGGEICHNKYNVLYDGKEESHIAIILLLGKI